MRKHQAKNTTARIAAANAVIAFLLIFSCLKLWGASRDYEGDENPLVLNIIPVIIWEGAEIKDQDVEALMAMRSKLPDQNFLHFISPAYFVKNPISTVTAAMAKIMRDGDEFGVYIAPWRTVANGAGVIFRDSPTFWGYQLNKADCRVDCGRDIPLGTYTDEEVAELVAFSLQTLQNAGFHRTQAALVAGWNPPLHVLAALQRNGIKTDYSGLAPAAGQPTLRKWPLGQWLNDHWQLRTRTAFASSMHTTATGSINLWSSVIGPVDWGAPREFSNQLEKAAANCRSQSSSCGDEINAIVAIHQETASAYAHRLVDTLQSITTFAAGAKLKMQFSTGKDTAAVPRFNNGSMAVSH